MFRDKQPSQVTLFIPGGLSDYIPNDHILKRVHAILDLRWLADEVRFHRRIPFTAVICHQA